MMRRLTTLAATSLLLCLIHTTPLFAQETGTEAASWQMAANTLWVMVAAFLVFWMNAGFAMVETGFCRAKNAVNILAKNFVVFAIASIAFYVVGFGLMFGDGNALFGTSGFLVESAGDNSATFGGAEGEAYVGVFSSLSWATELPLSAKFFFQLVFAATAATIVSGAVAERIHFPAFILFSALLVAIVYPIAGHWIWGGGLLAEGGLLERITGAPMLDFAGSTVVHSIGGWAALAGVLLLGPRLGKYQNDGSIQPIRGHNMALATLGGLILWLGWFGFNPGSTMQADGPAIAHIALTTNLAAAAGILTALITARRLMGSYDLSMIINGALAGLVAITAPCAFVTPPFALLIGAVAGVLVVFSVIAFDRYRVDDPVGALSVHLVNGIWGTLAVGLFANPDLGATGLIYGGTGQFLAQAMGIVVVGAFAFLTSLGMWFALKATMGIRVTAEQESLGLDLSEMGMEAYPSEHLLPQAPGAFPASTPAPVAQPALAPSALREATPQPVNG